tara:strand:+ start:2678 stop:3928 length:1251 start_codon:yes stop_codon:yes gene_type:complete
MADTDKKIEALEAEAVSEANAKNPMADAPKKNAVAAEPSHIAKMNNAEDLGPAVVKPTDSNPDATKKSKKVSDQISATADKGGSPDTTGRPNTQAGVTQVSHPGQAMKVEETDSDKDKDAKEKEVKEDDKKDDEVKAKEVKEGELPPALKKAIDAKKDEKKESKITYSKEEIDVKEHVEALVSGESDLTEEFKNKAATIFEGAIKSKVDEIAEKMEAEYNTKLNEEISATKETMVTKVDSYLNYVVEEWMKENQIALEKGIKGEIAEDFISGLKKLFEDHYIDVPDEKYDVLEDQASKIETLEKQVNEEIEKNVELKKSSGELNKQAIKQEVASDLADTQKEKFNKLSEEIEYSNEKDYKAKVETIKESYFGKKSVSGEQVDDVAVTDGTSNEDLSNAMAAYSTAISKYKNIKIAK